MNQQPEALRLADLLDEKWHRWKDDPTDELRAAAELRRLHAENEDFRATCDHLTRENAGQIGEIVALKEQRDELLEALKELMDREWQDDEGDFTLEVARKKSRAAIAKATGETK